MSSFQNYRSFEDEASMQEFCDVLEKHAIPYQTSHSSMYLNEVYGANMLEYRYHVSIPPEYFSQTNLLWESKHRLTLQDIPPDHYLQEFTIGELWNLLRKKDEWAPEDAAMAKLLLAKREEHVSEDRLRNLEQERIEELKIPGSTNYTGIVLGYLMCVLFFPGAIICGYLMRSRKKTLPNGETVYLFNKTEREHGIVVLALGTGVMAFIVYYKLLPLLL
ncbi:MAG: hypothetical protein MUF42_06600 [Cytophagaceae bacterium]|jgi:hypothetical protein|nr:hypothetical protein [Cytophagaceae bacterium]